MAFQGKWKHRIGRFLLCLGAILLLSFLYLTLIVGQPQNENRADHPSQPILSSSPTLEIAQESELFTLISSFPVPVMSFMSGSGMSFVSGTSADAPFQNGYGRIATLYWQTAEGQPLILQSIYPAAALELMGKGDYIFSAADAPALFGQPSVRMENRDTVRLYTVTDSGIYVITAPRSLTGSFSVLTRSIQLFTVE